VSLLIALIIFAITYMYYFGVWYSHICLRNWPAQLQNYGVITDPEDSYLILYNTPYTKQSIHRPW